VKVGSRRRTLAAMGFGAEMKSERSMRDRLICEKPRRSNWARRVKSEARGCCSLKWCAWTREMKTSGLLEETRLSAHQMLEQVRQHWSNLQCVEVCS